MARAGKVGTRQLASLLQYLLILQLVGLCVVVVQMVYLLRVLRRIPHANLPVRSTTSLRKETPIPYRVDLAGAWIDQPYVSKYHPGWAITASIEPTIEFNERSGMATSTRKKAIELWNDQLPMSTPEKLAKILFSYDNDPGTKDVSGSQDSIGIVVPGVNRFYYEKEQYWPSVMETVSDISVIKWLEERLYMVTLWPRPSDFVVLEDTKINTGLCSRGMGPVD